MSGGEWPLEAVIEQRDEDGTWKFAGAIRDVKTGEAWIAKHGLGEDTRVRLKSELADSQGKDEA